MFCARLTSLLYYMTSPGQTDLGAALRQLRKRGGLTLEDLASRAASNAPYLSRVEAGLRDIRWSTLNRLLAALGTDLRELQDTIERGSKAADDDSGDAS
jgi:transcriptional regulator with XRE-family HTH domain